MYPYECDGITTLGNHLGRWMRRSVVEGGPDDAMPTISADLSGP
jgi:hypothetical protein